MPNARRRPAPALFAALSLAIILPVLGVTQSASAEPGPPYTLSKDARLNALTCYGDLRRSAKLPILLAHGTGVTAKEEWDITYRPELLKLGHSVCTVEMPDYGFGDVQATVEVVATAIREMVRRSGGRKLSILGHSQGAFQPIFALRVYPDLAQHVDDFIGLAGIYNMGSAAIDQVCKDGQPDCTQAFQQIRTGSKLLGALSRRALPAGPSYTAIGTNADEKVTPQPSVNRMPGMTSMQIQQVCPGRKMPIPQDHVLLVGDAIAYDMVMDALNHPGPASLRRISNADCGKIVWDGVDLVGFLGVLPAVLFRNGTLAATEPPLRCFLRADCSSVTARGRMLTNAKAVRRGTRVRVVVHAVEPGRVRLVIGKRTLTRQVQAGRSVLVVRRAHAKRIAVQTRPEYYSRYLTEQRLRVRR